MSDHCKDTLVVVFGAGGRIGQALLPQLAQGPWDVLGIARDQKPAVRPLNVHWMQIDVTEVEHWQRSLRALRGMADIYKQVIVIDLLLSRSAVSAMRHVLSAGTLYITRLRTWLEDVRRPCTLVVASTTAVLAPEFYQTPYGRAKRRQLFEYQTANLFGTAILLPLLVDSQDFELAAQRIERVARATRSKRPDGLDLVAHPCEPERGSKEFPFLRQLANALTVQMCAWTTQRDSLLAHRLVARSRLALTPWFLRRRLDHHFVPANLLNKLAARLHAGIRLVR